MKRSLFVIGLVILLLLIVSCKKNEPGPNTGGLNSMNDFIEFFNTHEWNSFIFVSDHPFENTDADDNSMMYIYAILFKPTNQEFRIDGSYMMSLNAHTVPLTRLCNSRYYFEEVAIPKASTIDVLIKKDETTLFEKKMNVPVLPAITHVDQSPDWTQPTNVKWSLAKDSTMQFLSVDVKSPDYEVYKDYLVNPSARSYNIPAEDFNLTNVIYAKVSITEAHIAEYQSSAVLVATMDNFNYGAETAKTAEQTAGCKKFRILKLLTHTYTSEP